MIGDRLSPDITAQLEKYSPYLKELRQRFLSVVFVFLGFALFGFIFYEQIIKFLIQFLALDNVNIVFTSPFQFINLAISCGLASGLIVAIPVIILQLLAFLKPGLKKSEYHLIVDVIPFALILFIIGFIFGVLIMRWQIQIFLERAVALHIGNVLDISGLLSSILVTATLLGVGFEFPIIMFVLLRLKVLNPKSVKAQRRWVYLGAFIFAILLPADSILADVLLAMPLIILFESTLVFNKLFEKKLANLT